MARRAAAAKKPAGRPRTKRDSAASTKRAAATKRKSTGRAKGASAVKRSKKEKKEPKAPRARVVLPYGWVEEEYITKDTSSTKKSKAESKPAPATGRPSRAAAQATADAQAALKVVKKVRGGAKRKVYKCSAVPASKFVTTAGLQLFMETVDTYLKREDGAKRKEGDDPNEDYCMVCDDGGNVVCCDTCVAAVHPACCGIKHSDIPSSGDFKCPLCCWKEWLAANPAPSKESA